MQGLLPDSESILLCECSFNPVLNLEVQHILSSALPSLYQLRNMDYKRTGKF